MANLVKIVNSQGMWYEEIHQEEANALEKAFGSNFEVSLDQVLEIIGGKDIPFGASVKPEEIKSDDRLIGTCYL